MMYETMLIRLLGAVPVNVGAVLLMTLAHTGRAINPCPPTSPQTAQKTPPETSDNSSSRPRRCGSNPCTSKRPAP